MTSTLRRSFLLVATGLVAAAIAAGAASAGLISGIVSGVTSLGPLQALGNCGYGPSSQVFQPWGDLGNYSLVPQGDLASTSSWLLNGARPAADHDPFGASAGSLAFSSNGASAVSPPACFNLDSPTLRFFVSDQGGFGHGYVNVTLYYLGANGALRSQSLGRVDGGGTWQPTPTIFLGLDLGSLLMPNGSTPIAFGFQAGGLSSGETVSVDGIYVDPCRSR